MTTRAKTLGGHQSIVWLRPMGAAALHLFVDSDVSACARRWPKNPQQDQGAAAPCAACERIYNEIQAELRKLRDWDKAAEA